MPDERIEVEWVATATKMNQTLERLNTKLDKQEKKLESIGRTSKKASNEAATGFNKLEKELKDNEAQLRKLAIGSKEFEKQKQKVDALRSSLAKAKQQIGSTGTTAAGVFRTGIGHIARMVSGVASLHTMVRSVVAELEKAERIKTRAADTERTLEQALADIGQNIGGENIATAREMIRQNAPQLGATQEGLANLLGTAISAGAKDLQEALSVSAAALKVTVGESEKAQALIGGALDVASLGQSTDFEGAIGQLLQVQSQVRSTNLSEFANNIGPAIAAATAQGANQQGLSTEQALELSAVVSQIIKDPTGANTATAVRQFVTRLDAFSPELEKTLKDGTEAALTQSQIEQFKAATTVDQRVALMRETPALAQQFLETQKEGIGKVAIREIVQGSERALGFEQRAQEAVTSIETAGQTFNTLVENVDQQTGVLRAERRQQANLQRFETGGEIGREGQAIKILKDTIERVDLPGLDMIQQYAIDADLKLATDKQTEALRILEKLLSGGFGGFGKRELSVEEKELIQTQIELLKELRADRQRPVQVQQPRMRPKVEPLPAASVP